jgi:ElaB/YqjD/DUF883 family membrane-anchored ribosome-binding protein
MQMETLTKTQAKTKHNGRDTKSHIRTSKSHIKEAAGELLHEGKKLADEIYKEGLHKVNEAEDSVKMYSDQLLRKAKQNPMSAILIAAGVGFVLSALLRK